MVKSPLHFSSKFKKEFKPILALGFIKFSSINFFEDDSRHKLFFLANS